MNDFINTMQHTFNKMMSTGKLFKTDASITEMWDTYLNSFPPELNPIYRTNTVHDCNCCKSFVRQYGNIVAIKDNKMITIWDHAPDDMYVHVAQAMASLVRSSNITSRWSGKSEDMGTHHNYGKDGIKYNHLYLKLKSLFVNITTYQYASYKDVFKRSLEEVSIDSIDIVRDLIKQGSLYRGSEHKHLLNRWANHHKAYHKLKDDREKDLYCWYKANYDTGYRNTVIGTLVVDIEDGKSLENAVGLFESKVAPHNYKRSKSLVTPGMVAKAKKAIEDLGLENALQRRHAVPTDITINNLIFVDNSDSKKEVGVFEQLIEQAAPKNLDKVENVSVDVFINDILPTASSISVLMKDSYYNNLMSVIAPEDNNAPNILKWDNNFSWTYNGDVTDGDIKERVKKAGGSVDGYLRVSLS